MSENDHISSINPLFRAPQPPSTGPDRTERVSNSAPAGPRETPTAEPSTPPHRPPTVSWGQEKVEIVDQRPLPDDYRTADVTRREVVTALRSNKSVNITDEGKFALTYSAVPSSWALLKETAKRDLFTPRRPSAMRVLSGEIELYLPGIMPGPQPRTETDPSDVSAPRLTGTIVDGKAVADLVITVENQDHLEKWLRQVIRTTDKEGGPYQTSIIEKGVSEPLTVVMATVVILDDGEGHEVRFTVPVAMDGITRIIRGWQVHLGASAKIDEVADAIIRSTVRPAVRQSRVVRSHHKLVAEARVTAIDAWRSDCALAGVDGIGEKAVETALRTQQALTVRAKVVVGADAASKCGLAAADQFPDAAAELVRFTQENKAWRQEASNANAMSGVVRTLKGSGDVNDDLADYLLGTFPMEQLVDRTLDTLVDAEFAAVLLGEGDTLSEDLAALYRASFVMRFFTGKGVWYRSKADLRTTFNAGQIRNTHYAHALAPLIDAPWRSPKSSSLTQARNSYKRLGTLTDEVKSREGRWQVEVVADPLHLYQLALAGDVNARLTLQTAGGAALIADRFLTTEVIAGVGSGGKVQMDWRASSVAEVITLLAHPNNHRGLLQLAVAMREFQSCKEAVNSFTELALERRIATDAGQLYVVHAAAEDLLETHADGLERKGGTEVELTTKLLMLIADYDGSRRKKETGGHDAEAGSGNGSATPEREMTLQQIIDRWAANVTGLATTSEVVLEKTLTPAYRIAVDRPKRKDIRDSLRGLQDVLDWIEDNADFEAGAWDNDAGAAEADVYEEETAAYVPNDRHEASYADDEDGE